MYHTTYEAFLFIDDDILNNILQYVCMSVSVYAYG